MLAFFRPEAHRAGPRASGSYKKGSLFQSKMGLSSARHWTTGSSVRSASRRPLAAVEIANLVSGHHLTATTSSISSTSTTKPANVRPLPLIAQSAARNVTVRQYRKRQARACARLPIAKSRGDHVSEQSRKAKRVRLTARAPVRKRLAAVDGGRRVVPGRQSTLARTIPRCL